MGGRWVCFQLNVEQPGFLIWMVFKGLAGPYWCLEEFLLTMGVFSVVSDPTHMGLYSQRYSIRGPPASQWGVEYHVPDSHHTEGLTVTSDSFVHGTCILPDVIEN